MVQPRTGCLSAIARERADAIAGNRRNCPVRRDLANPVFLLIGDIQIARTVQRQPPWNEQPRLGRRSAIAAEMAGRAAGHATDQPARRNFPDAGVVTVAEEHLAAP